MPPTKHYELTDEQWNLIRTLMPKRQPGGRWNDHRTTLDGMMWVLGDKGYSFPRVRR